VRVDIGDGVRLFIDVVGAGVEATPDAMVPKPTLMLLHGGPGFDHSSFRPYFDRFADTHQVVYVDQRGHGRSDQRDDPSGWDLDTWADDVVRLSDALEIERPVVLGTSFGGFVAIRYAARHPGHASKLILSSTLAHLDLDLIESRFEDRGGPEAAASYHRLFVDGDQSLESWIDYAEINLPLYNHVPSGFGPHRALDNLEVLQHFHVPFSEMDLRDDVRAIDVPTLVLAGRDDPITPHECSTEISRLLPDGLGRLEIIEQAGHGTFRDQPDETERLLRDFFAEAVSPGAGSAR
jgi:pimeloyl-ACP methyl ester carboxylesterase